MANTPPLEQAPVGKTFVVAVGLLVAVALLQAAAFFWVFLTDLNRRTLQASSQPQPVANIDNSRGIDTEEIVTGLLSRFEGTRGATDSLAQPTPVPSGLAPISDNPLLEELVTLARGFRERGDIPAAMTKLREAQAIAPNNPEVIAEMAYTFEAIGSIDKSIEQWRRVYEIGPAAGVLFNMAEMKMNRGVGRQAASPTRAPQEEVTFQDGSIFAFAGVRAEEIMDPNVRKRLILDVPVKVRQGEMIDSRAVVLGVYFYDLLENEHLVQTNAEVSYEWLSPPADWAEDGMEVLRATYVLPAFSENDLDLSVREYLGYIVRVYYNNELQDVRAEPIRLLNEFPPPLRLEETGDLEPLDESLEPMEPMGATDTMGATEILESLEKSSALETLETLEPLETLETLETQPSPPAALIPDESANTEMIELTE